MTLNIVLLGRQPKCFLNFPVFECHFLSFIFSDIGFLVFSKIDVSFWLFSVRTRERRYWGGSVHTVHYKSRKSLLKVGRVSWPRDHQYAQFFGSLFYNVATLGRNVAKFQRRDVHFTPLCHVTMWSSNVTTSILSVFVTSRRGFPTSRRQFLYSLERRDVDLQRRDVNFYPLWNVAT